MKEATDTSTDPKDSAAQRSGHRNFNVRHLLAATDFSPASERTVDYAVHLARRLGARLTLLHVVPPPSDLGYSLGGGVSTEQIEEWQKEAEKKLAEQLARAKLEYKDVDSVQRTGHHPRDEIVRAATDLSADLLVISTQGHTGAMHFLVGSDAEHIIEHAQCPTLIVR
ncbi:MAG TPA: universal stress protein [Silvibacterium sp.]|nr:universal stress protein [Silvibacterium sp.]